jgi:hypothetical protein
MPVHSFMTRLAISAGRYREFSAGPSLDSRAGPRHVACFYICQCDRKMNRSPARCDPEMNRKPWSARRRGASYPYREMSGYSKRRSCRAFGGHRDELRELGFTGG